jgi:hypothetical protein
MAPATARLPGIQPAAPGDWLRVDDAFAAQMALRDRLICEIPDKVHALLPQAEAAAGELLAFVLQELPNLRGYRRAGDHALRPDGVRVSLDGQAPLLTLGRLVQEDFCLHLPQGDEHALAGAILCFPASWTLAEKIGRPLTAIHTPVDSYDEQMAARVQRMFTALRPGQVIWRANALLYADPSLHHPRPENAPRERAGRRDYLRSERQCLLKLPQTGAVVFSIHTSVVHVDAVPPGAMAVFRSLHP